MIRKLGRLGVLVCLAAGSVPVVSVMAQSQIYRLYTDEPVTPSLCDAVNLAQDTAAVFDATGELELLDGTVVPFSEVDEDGVVSVDSIPAGFIEFADDGDDNRKLWWLWFDGSVVDYDPRTDLYGPTNRLPADFLNVPCDVCEVIDDIEVCGCEGDPDCCVENADCDDGNECTTDLCESFTCVYENRDAVCDDGDECTEDDICIAGECSGVDIEGCIAQSGASGSGSGGGAALTFSFCGSGASLAMCLTVMGLFTARVRRR